MLPVLQDLLRTNNDLELRSLTGFLRNLSRHARDKNDFCKYPSHSLPLLHSMICFKPQVAIILLVPNCTLWCRNLEARYQNIDRKSERGVTDA